MTARRYVALSIVLVLFNPVLWNCGKRSVSEDRKAAGKRISEAVTRMGEKNGATLEWAKPFDNRFVVFTFELQRALAEGQNRPVVLRGDVRDVYRNGATAYVVLDQVLLYPEPQLSILLACPSSAIDALTKEDVDGSPEFAFVAVIDVIRKPVPTGNSVVAEGRCSDWLNLEAMKR